MFCSTTVSDELERLVEPSLLEESVVFAVFKGFEFSSVFCVTFSLSPRLYTG
jgi:hypothetical protein